MSYAEFRIVHQLCTDEPSSSITVGRSAQFKEMLMNERKIEMAFQNHRLFDLFRFGETESGIRAFATSNYILFDANDLLLPIPQHEIDVSKVLRSQNPGY